MNSIANFFLEPLAHDFMRQALFVSVLIGLSCSIFSCYLVLKSWSLLGDAISHAVLPGIIIAYVLNLPLLLGAFFSGFSCSLLIAFLKKNSRVKEDAIMGIVFSGMFALGLVMLAKVESDIHLMHILFGNLLGMHDKDIITVSASTLICVLVLVIKRKDFLLYCFDPMHSNTLGLSNRNLNFLLIVLLTIIIVSAIKAAGIILVIAMLVTPGASALLITRSFQTMMLVAISLSVFTCIMGTLISYHIDSATAPTIIVMQAAIFLCCFIFSKFKVLLSIQLMQKL